MAKEAKKAKAHPTPERQTEIDALAAEVTASPAKSADYHAALKEMVADVELHEETNMTLMIEHRNLQIANGTPAPAPGEWP